MGKKRDTGQAAAVKRTLRGRGIEPPAGPPEPPAPGAGAGEGGGAPQLPRVRIPGPNRMLSQFASEVANIVRTNGVFIREQTPVYLPRGERQFVPLTASAFRTYAEYSLAFVRARVVEGAIVEEIVPLSDETARAVVNSPQFLGRQRRLDRVNDVPLPVMRADGRIELLGVGYDEESATLTVGDLRYRDMGLDEAVTLLRDLLGEFPFRDAPGEGACRNLSVQVAAMVTVFGLGLLDRTSTVPMFIYTANAPRSGKTLLMQAAVVPVHGQVRLNAYARNDEELRKRLDGEAMSGSRYVCFDNAKVHISSATLEAWITAPMWGGRVLGTPKLFEVEKQSVTFLTANNCTVSEDLANRSLFVDLFVPSADPQDRAIARPIDYRWLCAPATRRDILSALWALVRHWDASGRPGAGRQLAGFGEWSDVCAAIVRCAGIGDPLEKPVLAVGGNEEAEDMLALVERLVDTMEGDEDEFEFEEVVKACLDLDLFHWMTDGAQDAGALSQRGRSLLGKLMVTYGGRVFRIGGAMYQFGFRGRNRQRRYRLLRVEGP